MSFFEQPRRSIVIVRHGETEWNAARRIQGRTEVPLNEVGEAQAAEAAALLREAGQWSRVITSPLGRAQQTASIIADELELAPPVIDRGVIERDFGQAEGVCVADAQATWPGLNVPDAEPLEELSQRGAAALSRILHEQPGSVVIAHGALMRSALGELAGTEIPRIANGELWLIEAPVVSQSDHAVQSDHAGQANGQSSARPIVRRIATPSLAEVRN